jgi:hypothetical protein
MRLKRWSEVDESYKEAVAGLLVCAMFAGTMWLMLFAPWVGLAIMVLMLLAALAYPLIEWGDDA